MEASIEFRDYRPDSNVFPTISSFFRESKMRRFIRLQETKFAPGFELDMSAVLEYARRVLTRVWRDLHLDAIPLSRPIIGGGFIDWVIRTIIGCMTTRYGKKHCRSEDIYDVSFFERWSITDPGDIDIYIRPDLDHIDEARDEFERHIIQRHSRSWIATSDVGYSVNECLAIELDEFYDFRFSSAKYIQYIITSGQEKDQIIDTYDIDCCCAWFDGSRIQAFPRTYRAWIKSENVLRPNRFSATSEKRLLKYYYRGYNIAFDPSLDHYFDGEPIEPSKFRTSDDSTRTVAEKIVSYLDEAYDRTMEVLADKGVNGYQIYQVIIANIASPRRAHSISRLLANIIESDDLRQGKKEVGIFCALYPIPVFEERKDYGPLFLSRYDKKTRDRAIIVDWILDVIRKIEARIEAEGMTPNIMRLYILLHEAIRTIQEYIDYEFELKCKMTIDTLRRRLGHDYDRLRYTPLEGFDHEDSSSRGEQLYPDGEALETHVFRLDRFYHQTRKLRKGYKLVYRYTTLNTMYHSFQEFLIRAMKWKIDMAAGLRAYFEGRYDENLIRFLVSREVPKIDSAIHSFSAFVERTSEPKKRHQSRSEAEALMFAIVANQIFEVYSRIMENVKDYRWPSMKELFGRQVPIFSIGHYPSNWFIF